MSSAEGSTSTVTGKSQFRLEITMAASGRLKAVVMVRVADGDEGSGQTRWESIGTISTHRGVWEQLEAMVVLGAGECGVGVEVEERGVEVSAESDWAKARRVALEGMKVKWKEAGVEKI